MQRDSLIRRRVLQTFGSSCQRCGYNRCTRALQFHHTDKSEKYEWAKSGRASPREIEAHPERFELLCANCHLEEHEAQDEAKRYYVTCAYCEARFPSSPLRVADNRDRFCSRACRHKQRGMDARDHVSLIPRFWKYAVKGDGCWEWTGPRVRRYPIIPCRSPTGTNTSRSAARISYEVHHGPIPPRVLLRRTCENGGCVNPAHLFVA